MESDVITLQDIYEFKIESIAPDRTIVGGLKATGLRPIFVHKFEKHGIEMPTDMFTSPEIPSLANVARGRS